MGGDKRSGSNSFDEPHNHSSASQPLLEEKVERYTDGPQDIEDDYHATTLRQTGSKKRRRLVLIAVSAGAVAVLAGFLTLVIGRASIAGHAACTMERMGMLPLPDYIKETSSVPNPFAASTRCGMLDLHKRRQGGEDLRQIWRNVPFEGGMQATYLQNVPPKDLQSENITEVKAVLRAVVVDTGDPTVWVPASSDLLQVRFFIAIWDFPLKDTNHASWTRLEKHVWFNITLTDPTTGQVYPGQQTRKAYADLQTHFPAHLFAKNANTTASSRPAPVYQIALRVMYGEQSAASFDFLLHQTWTPYTKFATCLKPMYSPKEPSHSVEWRAHHKAMGFQSVHWSSRNASAAADVARMNERMGLTDTFEWIPMLGSSLHRTPFFDEELLFPECYAMYRRTAEWIAVHDTDEYLGFRDQLPWTSDFTATWFDNLPKTVKSIKAPFAWVDNNRFQHIPHEEYLAVDPTITEEEMNALDKLALTSQGLRPMTETYGMLLKSIHRTDGIDVALVHLGFWGQSASQYPAIDLYAYHVRGGQGEDKSLYQPFHITPSTLAFWRKQASYVAMAAGIDK